VRLERDVKLPTRVTLYSDSPNVLFRNARRHGPGWRGSVVIPAGKREGTFEIVTNANNLGQRETATYVTAHYGESHVAEMVLTRP
jgi:hypothetical protein